MPQRYLNDEEQQFIRQAKEEAQEIGDPEIEQKATRVARRNRIISGIFNYKFWATIVAAITLASSAMFMILINKVNDVLGTGVLETLQEVENKTNAQQKANAQKQLDNSQLGWMPQASYLYTHRYQVMAIIWSIGLVLIFVIIILGIIKNNRKPNDERF